MSVEATSVRIDTTMTAFMRAYKFGDQFAYDRLARHVTVPTSAGRYKTLGSEMSDINVADQAGTAGEAGVIGATMSEATFKTYERKLKTLVTDKTIREAPAIFNPMKFAALLCTTGLKLRAEKRVSDLADATSNTTTPSDDWDDELATIVADVNAGKKAFKTALGDKPTDWLIPDHVADEIVGQADIVDLIKYSAAMAKPTSILDNLSADDLPKRMFGMNVLMPNCRYTTNEPGVTRVLANIWGDESYLFRVDPSGMSNGWAVTPTSRNLTVVKWRTNDPEGWWVMAVWEVDHIEVAAGACHQFIDVT